MQRTQVDVHLLGALMRNLRNQGSHSFRKAVMASLGVLFLIVVMFFGMSHEPVANGESLSIRLEQLSSLDSEKSEEAREAIRQMGSNAVPFLLARLEERDGLLTRVRDRIVGVLPGIEHRNKPRSVKRSEVVQAFRVLGDNGAAALPKLETLLTNRIVQADLDYSTAVAQSIAGVGERGRLSLETALKLGQQNTRLAGLVALSELTNHSSAALRLVAELTSDADPEIRGLAILFMARHDKDDAQVETVLRRAAEDPDPQVRVLARKELERRSARTLER